MSSGARPPASGQPSLWRALRANPLNVTELAAIAAIPWLRPWVKRWARRGALTAPDETASRRARRLVRHSTGTARWVGTVTGSAFYLGMVPAIAMIYFEQLTLVLRIAALYGHDPDEPARAAELLVIQGRYDDVEQAAAGIRSAGTRSRATERRISRWFASLRELPALIGIKVRQIRGPLDVIIVAVEVLSFFVPVVSIPIWAIANARATRRLGNSAIRFYQERGASLPTPAVVLPHPPPSRRRRIWAVTLLATLLVTLAVLTVIIPWGVKANTRVLPLGGRLLAELALLVTFSLLIRIAWPIAGPGHQAKAGPPQH